MKSERVFHEVSLRVIAKLYSPPPTFIEGDSETTSIAISFTVLKEAVVCASSVPLASKARNVRVLEPSLFVLRTRIALYPSMVLKLKSVSCPSSKTIPQPEISPRTEYMSPEVTFPNLSLRVKRCVVIVPPVSATVVPRVTSRFETISGT